MLARPAASVRSMAMLMRRPIASAVLLALSASCALLALSQSRVVANGSTSSGIPTVTLNNGIEMPMLSLGIWQFSDAEVEEIVPLALKVGYNHFDASIFYGTPENNGRPNQPALGRVLADVPRDSYFLTTKIDPSYEASTPYSVVTSALTVGNAYYRTLEQVAHNLGDLELEYADLILVHWSSPTCEVMREVWRGMEQAAKLGWVRSIGVSNYCPRTLDCILETATIVPAVNQVKYHAGLDGADPGKIKSYCEAHGIQLQAYSPLGGGGKAHTMELVNGPLVSSIGAKYGMSGAQVSLRWVSQNRVALSTKSTSEAHLKGAIATFGFELEAADVEELNAFVQMPKQSYSFTCDCKETNSCSESCGPSIYF